MWMRLSEGWFGPCYDKFEKTVYKWSEDSCLSSDPKFSVYKNKRCLSGFWIDFISRILDTISCMHDQKLYHKELSFMSSYVFVEGKLKLKHSLIQLWRLNEISKRSNTSILYALVAKIAACTK